jgi:hypothetical protein
VSKKLLKSAIFVLLAVGAAGCTTTKYASNKDQNFSGKIKYLGITTSMASAPFVGTFNSNLASMLSNCGITPIFLNTPLDENSIRGAMQKTYGATIKLDSTISIAAVAFTKNGYGTILSYDYELILRDSRGQKVWKAQMNFLPDSVALVGKDKGQALASEIVTHMTKDGALAGCPAPAS